MKFGSDKIKYPGRFFALIFLCAALLPKTKLPPGHFAPAVFDTHCLNMLF
jgi:hypothetical protein